MEPKFIEHASKLLDTFSAQLQQSPTSLSYMIMAVDFRLGPRQEIVIAGNSRTDDTEEMLKSVRAAFLPNAVVLLHQTEQADKDIEKIIPFLANHVPIDGKATAYLCENYACNRPTNNITELNQMLTAISHPADKSPQ
jgi:uncharacterized protein YyaL (SSP411 family)